MKQVRVMIKGRVQGVFFRVSTQEMAIKLGVTGWVKNCPDGSVEAVFQGTASSVDAVVEWCHKGSPQSLVETVSVELEDIHSKYQRFLIEETKHLGEGLGYE